MRQSVSVWEEYESQEFMQRVESEKNKGKDKSSDQSSSSQNQSSSGEMVQWIVEKRINQQPK